MFGVKNVDVLNMLINNTYNYSSNIDKPKKYNVTSCDSPVDRILKTKNNKSNRILCSNQNKLIKFQKLQYHEYKLSYKDKVEQKLMNNYDVRNEFISKSCKYWKTLSDEDKDRLSEKYESIDWSSIKSNRDLNNNNS